MQEIESKKKQETRNKCEENVETNIKIFEVEKYKQQELAKRELEDNVEEQRRIGEKSG